MTRFLLFSSSGDGEEASSSSTAGEGGSSCGGGSGDLSMIAEEEEDEGILRLTAAGCPSGFSPLSPLEACYCRLRSRTDSVVM